MDNVLKQNAFLKFKLFLHGLNVSNEQISTLQERGYRIPSIVRAGASFGIEARINNMLDVNIPLNNESSIYISDDLLTLYENDERLCSVDVLKHPYSYNLRLDDGREIINAANICYDRLGITVNTGCWFKKERIGCKFCGIDNAAHFMYDYKFSSSDVLAIIADAFQVLDKKELRHLLLSGGAFPAPEYGTKVFSSLAAAIKKAYPKLRIYVMLPPPSTDGELQRMIDSGVDEIGLNIELANQDSEYQDLIRGKALIGLDRYLSALSYLAKKLPPFCARSILMGGIEPVCDTLRGVELISSVGAMPILSYYRPIGKVEIKNGFRSHEEIFDLWWQADAIAQRNGTIIGPTCIPCQNNVIALPNTRYHILY